MSGTYFEIHTASFRSVRGYTIAGVVADEIAFWPVEDSANPDAEILNGLCPDMATVPGTLLLCTSSPHARNGDLWRAYREHYGKDANPVLECKADSASMNPRLDTHLLKDAYQRDEAAASGEYGAGFPRDIERFVSQEALDACVVPGRHELRPVPGVSYAAFVDLSGGASDAMTLAIAHTQDGRAVLDCVRWRRSSFLRDDVVQEFAALLTSYGASSVRGTRYAGLIRQYLIEKRLKK